MFLYMTLYIQTLMGFSPLQTGLRFLPFTIVSFFAAAITGRVSHRLSGTSAAVCRADAYGLGLLLWRDRDAHFTTGRCSCPGSSSPALGVGMVNPVLASAAIGVVTPQRSGMATGINNTFRQVGTADGHRRPGRDLRERADQASDLRAGGYAGGRSRRARSPARSPPVVPSRSPGSAARRCSARASTAIHVAFTAALNDILLVGGIVAFVGAPSP